MPLAVYNTLSKRKEVFEPLEPGKVRMYNCGPTVYSYAHIGNFASFLFADLLRRYLEYSGYEVVQVMNITDVGHFTEDDVADARGEDKLEKKAREERKDPWEIARFYESAFHDDRELLNIKSAMCYPRATEHIPEMIAMIQELLEAGLAYRAGGQVYFEIAKFPRYGILSGNSVEDLLAAHRIEPDPHKRSPLDFTLWKTDPKHIMQWDSPFGRGFPGWHIECSAMSRKYLGEVFDIHTGGEDNIFPHHECEIAQSSGGKDRICARYWLHRRYILVDGRKMSKSLGNFYTVRDLVARGYSGPEIRLALLFGHYRSNTNFTFQALDTAREWIRYLREFRRNMLALPAAVSSPSSEVRALANSCDGKFRQALDDDLNISAALATVREFVNLAYKVCGDRAAGAAAVERLGAWDDVLGVLPSGEPGEAPGTGGAAEARTDEAGGAFPASALKERTGLSAEEVEALLERRSRARAEKNFLEADRIRADLEARGIVVKDTPRGTLWHLEEA